MIRGLSAFPITPADADGRIDTAALQRLLQRLVDAGVDSVGLLGSTGSYPYLSRAERLRAIWTPRSSAWAAASRSWSASAPCGPTRRSLWRGMPRKRGPTAGLLAPVSYVPLLDAEVFEHFRAVARRRGCRSASTTTPAPRISRFSPELVGRLSHLDGVVAAKNPAPASAEAPAAVAAAALARPGVNFSVGFSVDWNAAATLLAGADAWYSVLAGIYPATCLRITRAAMSGDAAAVQRLDARLAPLWQLFRDAHQLPGGPSRRFHGRNSARPTDPARCCRCEGEAATEAERVLRDLALD